MNATPYNTMQYEDISDWTLSENKPNSNPIKANFNAYQTQTKPISMPIKPKQTQSCLSRNSVSEGGSAVEVISLECKIDNYGKIFTG